MVEFINSSQDVTTEVTVIVLGCGRGGTSAVAGMLRELGVGFPDQTHPLKHESSPIVYDGDQIDVIRTKEFLRRLDNRYEIWGWKSPKDIFTIHNWISLIRNPMFVVVFRHPVDAIRSIVRHELVSFEIAAKHVGEVNAELSRFILFTPFPVAVLSYEELCAKPWSIIPAIAEWLGLSLSFDVFRSGCDFVGGVDRRYRSLVRQRKLAAVEFSAQEVEDDRLLAQRQLFGQAIAELNDGIENLMADCVKAEDIILHLEQQLNNETNESIIQLPTSLAADVEERSIQPKTYQAAYHATKARFIRTSKRRLRLQQRLDVLTAAMNSSYMPDAIEVGNAVISDYF